MCLIFNHGGTLHIFNEGGNHKTVAQFLFYNWIQYEKEIIFSFIYSIEASLCWHTLFQPSDVLLLLV